MGYKLLQDAAGTTGILILAVTGYCDDGMQHQEG
jgi:hypothetical protein